MANVHAEQTDTIPLYQAQQQVAGTIRTWGHGRFDRDYIGGLVHSWETGFRQRQPAVEFDTTLRGNGSAIGGLYTGKADIALMERGPIAIELDAYQPILHHDPFEISVATGSLDVADHAMAPVILVNRDNPLSRLTLAQLDAIFGADHRRGLDNIRRWGELGLTGGWADKPINVYVPAIAQDTAQFFERAVMRGSQKWTGKLREFRDVKNADGTIRSAEQQIADALAGDMYGIALSTLRHRQSQVRPLALAAEAGGPYYEANRQNVAQRRYPLTRTVSVFINRAPGQKMDVRLQEYLRYILSREGQDAIARDGAYLPLQPELAQQEREKLQ